MKSLHHKVAVVTGAASGIGRALAELLNRRGCHLALIDVQGDALEALAQTLRASSEAERRISTHVVDVADKEAMMAMTDEVIAHHGEVHLLINNAGVSVTAPFQEHSLEDFEWLVGINLWGVVYGCKFFLPHLMRQPEAHIVNISSIFGIIGLPTQSSYAATKFAVRGFSESLRHDLAETTVRVTCVHPGAIQTNIVNASRIHGAKVPSRARIQRFFDRIGTPPSYAAAMIVGAVERDQARLLINRETYLLEALKRILPVWPSALVNRLQSSL